MPVAFGEGAGLDAALPAVARAVVGGVPFDRGAEVGGGGLGDGEDDAGVREAAQGVEVHEEDVATDWGGL